MPSLIRNIEATILDTFTSDIVISNVSTSFGQDDYFDVFGSKGLIQNFSQVTNVEEIKISNNFGLRINQNKIFELIEISY